MLRILLVFTYVCVYVFTYSLVDEVLFLAACLIFLWERCCNFLRAHDIGKVYKKVYRKFMKMSVDTRYRVLLWRRALYIPSEKSKQALNNRFCDVENIFLTCYSGSYIGASFRCYSTLCSILCDIYFQHRRWHFLARENKLLNVFNANDINTIISDISAPAYI